MYVSTVGLMLNPNTNRIGPQFHCICDDYFETVLHDQSTTPPNWDELIIEGISQLDIELDDDDLDGFIDN